MKLYLHKYAQGGVLYSSYILYIHPATSNPNYVPECIEYNKVWFGKGPLYSVSGS